MSQTTQAGRTVLKCKFEVDCAPRRMRVLAHGHNKDTSLLSFPIPKLCRPASSAVVDTRRYTSTAKLNDINCENEYDKASACTVMKPSRNFKDTTEDGVRNDRKLFARCLLATFFLNMLVLL